MQPREGEALCRSPEDDIRAARLLGHVGKWHERTTAADSRRGVHCPPVAVSRTCSAIWAISQAPISPDLIGDDENLPVGTHGREGGELGSPPDAARRVVRIAEDDDLDVLAVEAGLQARERVHLVLEPSVARDAPLTLPTGARPVRSAYAM